VQNSKDWGMDEGGSAGGWRGMGKMAASEHKRRTDISFARMHRRPLRPGGRALGHGGGVVEEGGGAGEDWGAGEARGARQQEGHEVRRRQPVGGGGRPAAGVRAPGRREEEGGVGGTEVPGGGGMGRVDCHGLVRRRRNGEHTQPPIRKAHQPGPLCGGAEGPPWVRSPHAEATGAVRSGRGSGGGARGAGGVGTGGAGGVSAPRWRR